MNRSDSSSPLSPAANVSQWSLMVLQPKRLLIDLCYKADICETTNKVSYCSLYSELIIHGGFMFVKLSQSLEKSVCSGLHNEEARGAIFIQVSGSHL